MIITCKIHGDFITTPNNHLNKKSSCPVCKESKGEKEIRLYLDNNNINYVIQKKFNGCRHKRKLPFDFYLPNYNMCIEYDGIQHFEPIGIFGGNKRYDEQQIKDNLKNVFCEKENIILIRIKYNDNIHNELIKNIK